MRTRTLVVFTAIVSLAAFRSYAEDKAKCPTPPAECERIIRQMLSGRRYLGVQIVELNEGGISIKAVVENSPAERAALHPGDRLMAVNGTATKDATINDFKKILTEASRTGRLFMIVQRHAILKPVEARMEPYTKAQIDKIVAQHLAEAHGIGAAPAQP